ncbi:MAG TPA: hypothetical protein VGD98_03325 [Ktedonobacteraceae bacterium]
MFLWRVLAHRLQQWARVASLQVGEEVYVTRQALASGEYSATESDSSVPDMHAVHEVDAQSVDGDLPPAHWLARVKSGTPPTSWLTRVSKDVPGYLPQKASAPRVPSVLAPEAGTAHVHNSLGGVERDQRHDEREIPYPEKKRGRQNDDGTAGISRESLDTAVPPQASIAPFVPSQDSAHMLSSLQRGGAFPFSTEHTAKLSQSSGGIIPSLSEDTTRFASLAPGSEALLFSSYEGEEPAFASKERSIPAPSRDTVNSLTLHTMAAHPLLSQSPASASSFLSAEPGKNEIRTSRERARTRLALEEREERWQRSLGPQSEKRPPGSPTAFAVTNTTSPPSFSAPEQLHEMVHPQRVNERMQTESHWPSLPESLKEETEDWGMAQRAWERQQRLDREQRGSAWNV